MRPIVSGSCCPTAQISRFVDSQLRPLVVDLPSYLKDTTEFVCHINKINKTHTLPTNSLLVSADVTSLYTNIQHADG